MDQDPLAPQAQDVDVAVRGSTEMFDRAVDGSREPQQQQRSLLDGGGYRVDPGDLIGSCHHSVDCTDSSPTDVRGVKAGKNNVPGCQGFLPGYDGNKFCSDKGPFGGRTQSEQWR